jgi:hypothetical protein
MKRYQSSNMFQSGAIVRWGTITFIVIQLFAWIITGTPDGAGGCEGGKAAVGGIHLLGEVISLTLEQAGVKVKLGGEVLSVGSTVLVPSDIPYEIRVESSTSDFIGVLIRVEAPAGVDTAGALTPDTNTKLAGVCGLAPIVGITHFDKDLKSFANGTIIFENNYKGVIVDVTVVFSVKGVSKFAYSRFLLDYFGSPTSAPVLLSRTTVSPTRAPQKPPTSAPQKPPTSAPQKPPSSAPQKPPTKAPLIPSMAPQKVPFCRPQFQMMMQPTSQPRRMRKRRPTIALTKAPRIRLRCLS